MNNYWKSSLNSILKLHGPNLKLRFYPAKLRFLPVKLRFLAIQFFVYFSYIVMLAEHHPFSTFTEGYVAFGPRPARSPGFVWIHIPQRVIGDALNNLIHVEGVQSTSTSCHGMLEFDWNQQFNSWCLQLLDDFEMIMIDYSPQLIFL